MIKVKSIKMRLRRYPATGHSMGRGLNDNRSRFTLIWLGTSLRRRTYHVWIFDENLWRENKQEQKVETRSALERIVGHLPSLRQPWQCLPSSSLRSFTHKAGRG